MTTRLLKSPTKRAPKDRTAWMRLAKQAIERAKAAGDRREHSIRLAVQKGQVEQLLRGWAIICEADLQREFPASKT